MSGGRFYYNQYKIREIWEDIQQELDKQGKEKSKEDLRYYDKEYFEKYPEEMVERAVKGMLPHNRLGRAMGKKLFVYRDANHKHEAQKPKALEIN